MKIQKYLPYILIVLFVFIFDQASKIYVASNFYLGEEYKVINGFLNFTYAHNKGVAFSFGADYSDIFRVIMFKFLPVLVCFYVLKLFFDSYKKKETLHLYAYALILGGAIGNILDRIRLDYVIDFIAVYSNGLNLGFIQLPSWHFAIFNIADSAISIAIALLILDYILNLVKKKNVTSN